MDHIKIQIGTSDKDIHGTFGGIEAEAARLRARARLGAVSFPQESRDGAFC